MAPENPLGKKNEKGFFYPPKNNKSYLEPQTTIYKWMFGEPTILYIKIWNHPITTIHKWLFGVPGRNFRGPLKFLLSEPSPVCGLSISTNDGIAGDWIPGRCENSTPLTWNHPMNLTGKGFSSIKSGEIIPHRSLDFAWSGWEKDWTNYQRASLWWFSTVTPKKTSRNPSTKQLKSKPPTIEEPVLGEAASFASFRAIFFGKTRTHLSLSHMIHVAPERNSTFFFGWGITFPPRSWESKDYPPSPWLPRRPTIFVALWKIQTTLLKEMPDHQGQLFDAGWMGNPYIPRGSNLSSNFWNLEHFPLPWGSNFDKGHKSWQDHVIN